MCARGDRHALKVQWLERIYQERLDSGQDTDESLESVGTLAWVTWTATP